MKNLKALADPKEITDYVGNLWRTDLFRKSHADEKGYIRGIVNALATKPVIFFDMEDTNMEWSHFTTWMGAYALRPGYENDTVHDLYYLHEFMHGATMEYDPSLSFVAWHRKMCENEMLASVHSEALVYFMLEGLRDQSFDFDIWVDRYLNNPDRFRLSKTAVMRSKNPHVVGHEAARASLLRSLSHARKEVMVSPDPFDFLEMQIHYYAMQNMQWSNIWKDNYREVESHMAAYHKEAVINRTSALEGHVAWLGQKRKEGGAVTPYAQEALSFAKIVGENKKRQGNDIIQP